MGKTRLDWERARRNPRGYEPSEPREKKTPARGGSHVKPGAVKTWAEMTPAERANVLARIKPPGTR